MIKTNKIKISIVLPVYNGEKFLYETIDSVLSQNFDGYELVIVNDGSSDSSVEIINHYAEHYKQVVVVNQPNSGICAARNSGISVSKGDYIMFCDHDDIFCENYLETAYNEITIGNYDFVKFSCEEIFLSQNEVIRSNVCAIKEMEYRGNEVPNIVLQYSKYNEYIWDGIYSRNIICDVGCFDTKFLAGCEDIDIMLKIISVADSCKTSSAMMYKHFIRNAFSTSRHYSTNTYISVREMYHKRIELAQKQIEKCAEKKSIGKGKPLSEDFEQYKISKTEQFVYALLGMFSFKSCDLSLIQIRKEFREIRNSEKLKEGIRHVKLFPITRNSVCAYMFRLRFYSLLALLCTLKRRISK